MGTRDVQVGFKLGWIGDGDLQKHDPIGIRDVMVFQFFGPTGMATRAPTIPKITPPSSTATTVTTDGISTVLPMIFESSR